MNQLELRLLTHQDIEAVILLTKELNPDVPFPELRNRQSGMFEIETYRCFGLFAEESLVGVAGGWLTVRLYSGKQLEIDHVIVDPSIQSKGYGKRFLDDIEIWAKNDGCETVELNTYVQNTRSHKFYFNQGYEILGYHFQKRMN